MAPLATDGCAALALRFALDAIGPNLLVQVRALDAQQDRRFGDVPVTGVQCLDDIPSFDRVPVLTERQTLRPVRGLARCHYVHRRVGGHHLVFKRIDVGVLGQIGDGNDVTRQDCRALHDVLQFSHIAWPFAAN